jgi:dihydrofolate reductase
MRKVLFFMMVSVDGFFEGPNREIDWHVVDEEFNEFAIGQLDSVDVLLFGRTTYEMMASYWPTPAAVADDPIVAGKMNSLPKVVFSRTLQKADWQNTRLVKKNVPEEVARLKEEPGRDLIIFGSSDLAVTLIQSDLLDELRIMIAPVVLGGGKTLFKGLPGRLHLKLLKTRTFRNGNVLLFYRPEKTGR